MKTSEIRQRFTQFFEKHDHLKLPSSSLVPHDDPTLLFANAGMNQFKDYFTGKANAKNPRATTVQKCVRAGGKHNDLENVGFTARHHTFFEMLGNFSFGDYFKSEAIDFAWKFLTKELGIDKDKLYVTVHESDQEAFNIWHQEQKIPKDRIFYLGDKDNFWEMGDTGPCGPCSEIFYDHGLEFSDGTDNSKCLLLDEGRYVEIWNLVFMQYEKKVVDGKIVQESLPKPSVDTGAGLERIAALMQGKYFNYDSDAFSEIIKHIEDISKKSYQEPKYQGSIRVIADHIRSTAMLISDGVIPSNEGRGYVLRRIIRRAVRHLNELEVDKISFYLLARTCLKQFKDVYPENFNNLPLVEEMLRTEEEKFRSTLSTGLTLIHKELRHLKEGDIFPGATAFKLYDTYGFPPDLTETILRDKKFKLDTAGFEAAMDEQKSQSKKQTNFQLQTDNLKTYYDLRDKHGPTNFLGYQDLTSSGKLIYFDDSTNNPIAIFDQTPFYGESGGQIGDSGEILTSEGSKIPVIDTQKVIDNIFLHILEPGAKLSMNQSYQLHVNTPKRDQIKRNHSATHLLQAALIKTLGAHVKQAGSLVTADKLRFDFTHSQSLTKKELESVEELINEAINMSHPVEAKEMSKDEADKTGAMSLFGEKYGDKVRVLTMGNFSCELCGGTHVDNTQEIEYFLILSESSLSSGIRRIEATTSKGAFEYLRKRSVVLKNLEEFLGIKDIQVLEKVNQLMQENKKSQKLIKSLQDQIQSHASKSLFNNKEIFKNGLEFVVTDAKEIPAKELRSLSDKFIDQDKKGIVLIFKEVDDKVSILLRTDKKNKYPCGSILKNILSSYDGSGGGRPDMGQGSAPKKHLNKIIEDIRIEVSKL